MLTKQRGQERVYLGVFVAVVALAFLLSSALLAEAQTGKESASQMKDQHQGTMSLREGFRASRIIDETVKNAQGEELGEVDDLIMSRNGKIKKVVLSVGGFLKIGERLVALPFKSLQINEKSDIVYNVSKEQLEKHPVFNYRQEGLYEYYYAPSPPYGSLGLRPPAGYRGYPQYGRPYGPYPPQGKYKGQYGPWQWEYFPERLRLSAILNRAVLNNKGEEVGQVDDLIINADGRVERIILSVGGPVDVHEKLVSMPFKQLKVTDLGIVYDVSKEELKGHPAFTYERK